MQWSLAHVVYNEYAEYTSENAVEIVFSVFVFLWLFIKRMRNQRKNENIEPL